MGGFVILGDGRAWVVAAWEYDALIDGVTEWLPETFEGRVLAVWLLEQRCNVRGSGDGHVDLRELTPDNQELFLRAAQDAFLDGTRRGPIDWFDPTCFRGWHDQLRRFLRMARSVRFRRPPGELNDMIDVLPVSGKQAGPGWEDVTPPRGFRRVRLPQRY
jgi:hypothetical protein